MSLDYPDFGESIAVHDALIEEFGGTMGMRDEGALAPAFVRPELGYYDGLIGAAALLESCANSDPCVDGTGAPSPLPAGKPG